MKRKKDDLAKKKGMENSTDMFIESLVYYGLGRIRSMLEDFAGCCLGFEGT
jgi:hypothetical protein